MTRLWRIIALFLFLAIGAPCPSWADPQPAPPALLLYLKQSDHLTVVTDIIKREASQIPGCHLGTVRGVELFVPGPVTFGRSGAPASGQWREVWTIDGCGQSGVFNILTLVDDQGKLHLIALLPGTTHASPVMQKDAAPYAFRAAAPHTPAGCKRGMIIDTEFLGFSKKRPAMTLPGHDGRSWREKWTVAACGGTTPVTLQFVPDANGITIKAVDGAPK